MIDLQRASAHIRLHRGRAMVIKVGGACLARPAALRRLARQLAVVDACGARPVVVHGGGPQTDAVQKLLGEEPRLVDGRRVTSPAALRALRMATAGELNTELAAVLSAEGVPAVGLCAASAGIVTARRRRPIATTEGAVDFGEVGDVAGVDPAPLRVLMDQHLVPVVCPPAGDGQGGFLNVNADLTAAALAAGLRASKLVLLTDAPGILRDPANPASLLSSLSLAELEDLEGDGALRGGMKVKTAAIRAALDGGVPRVHVVSGLEPDALLVELYTNHGSGTLITAEAETAPEEPGHAEAAEAVSP